MFNLIDSFMIGVFYLGLLEIAIILFFIIWAGIRMIIIVFNEILKI